MGKQCYQQGWNVLTRRLTDSMTSMKTSFFLYLMPSERHDTALVTVAGGRGAPTSNLWPSWVMYLKKKKIRRQVNKKKGPEGSSRQRQRHFCQCAIRQMCCFMYLSCTHSLSTSYLLTVENICVLWIIIALCPAIIYSSSFRFTRSNSFYKKIMPKQIKNWCNLKILNTEINHNTKLWRPICLNKALSASSSSSN